MSHFTCRIRMLAAVSAGWCLLLLMGGGTSAIQPDDVKPKIQAIADTIKNKNDLLAKNLAEKLGKNTEALYESMLTLKPRDKQGFGLGNQPGQIKPDGIEKKIQTMAATGVVNVAAEADALEQMGYRLAAIALVAKMEVPAKHQAPWKKWSEEMHDSALEFVAAVQKRNQQEVQKSVLKINNNCNKCHDFLRGWPLPNLQKMAVALEKSNQATVQSVLQILLKQEEILPAAMKTLKPGDPDYHAFGIGKLIATDPANGIEKKIHDLATNGIGVFQLVDEKAALLEMGHRVQAVALLTTHMKKEKEQILWDKYAREFHDSTQHFIKAVGTLKFRDVRRTAAKLEARCAQCHQKFR